MLRACCWPARFLLAATRGAGTLLATGANGKVRVPTVADAGLGTTWTNRTFNDAA